MEKIILKVEGMHCDGCKTRLENLLNKKKNISKAHVDLEKKTAEVEFEGITKEDIEGYIEAAGFTSLGE